MMDAMQAILTRRSVRHFTSQVVSPEDLKLLLRAAMQAPSSGNAQPWHFVVITQRDTLDRLAAVHASGPVLREAQAAVLVCGDERAEKNPGRWMLDCAAAMQNLLLAAHALGLGGVWLVAWPNMQRVEALRGVITLPEGVHPLALAALGHPAETPPSADRYNPAKVHLEQW